MSIRFAGAVILASAVLGTLPGVAAAAKPLTQKQYSESKLKTSFTAWAKTKLPAGVKVGAVNCTLPKSGITVHCTVAVSAPKYEENILFKVTETLHDSGQMTWVSTGHTCTDSKTGKAFTQGC